MAQIPILYEDDYFVAFDKPPGCLVVSAPGEGAKNLSRIVNEQNGPHPGGMLHPCHRLDRMTSGVIIFARGKANQQRMMEVFHQGAVEKSYIAFIKGRLKTRSGVIHEPVQDHYQRKFAGKSRPKDAVTRYQVVQYARGMTVVHVFPETGRTNQIRIHFSRMGHPLLGERVYAFRKDFDVDMKRLALHAHDVSFRHPVVGNTVHIVSAMPKDMVEFFAAVQA